MDPVFCKSITILILTILLTLSHSHAQQPPTPAATQPEQADILPLSIDPPTVHWTGNQHHSPMQAATAKGRILVKVRINQQFEGWFVIATSSPHTVVDRGMAGIWQIDRSPLLPLRIPAGPFRGGACMVNRMTLGAVDLRRPLWPTADLRPLSLAFGTRISGILGTDVLEQLVLDIQPRPLQVTAYRPGAYRQPANAVAITLKKVDQRYTLPVQCNGQTLEPYLATAASGNLLIYADQPWQTAKTMGLIDAFALPQVSRQAEVPTKIMGIAPRLTAMGVPREQVTIEIYQFNPDHADQQHDELGWAMAYRQPLILDLGRNTIYTLPATDAKPDRQQINQPDRAGYTPLLTAIRAGDSQQVKRLIDAGADVNQPGRGGTTPLIDAAARANTDILKMLIDAGADLKAKDDLNATAVATAARIKGKALTILIQAGAPVNKLNPEDTGPLNWAAQAGMTDNVRQLINAGARINDGGKQHETALFLAALFGRQPVVKLLIDNKVDLNTISNNGFTPLMAAIDGNQQAIAMQLVQAGAKPDIVGKHGITALHLAARRNMMPVVEHLLKAGLDVNAATQQGETPLYFAIAAGHQAMAEKLLAAGARTAVRATDNRTLLMAAIKSGLTDIALQLIDNPEEVHTRTMTGITPLMVAAQYGADKLIEPLIQAGADPNATTANEQLTPLMLAVHYPKTVRQLIDHKAKVTARSANGATALFSAITVNNLASAKLLLKAGANPDAQTDQGISTWRMAIGSGNTEMVQLLIDHDGKINQPDGRDLTPLAHAARQGQLAIVRQLIQAGANVNDQTRTGTTPLAVAARSFRPQVVQALIQAGANVNTPTQAQTSPLTIASAVGDRQVMQLLLDAGAKINSTDAQGATALMYAVKAGHLQAAEMLIRAGADTQMTNQSGQTALEIARQINDPLMIQLLSQSHNNQ